MQYLSIELFIYYLQDWALGVLHAKIIAAITLMGPQWWLKTVIEQVGFKFAKSVLLCFLLLTNKYLPEEVVFSLFRGEE